MKKILKEIKYPKLLLLAAAFVFAYFLFKGRNFTPLHDFLSSLGYLGTFISGILFVYGFTAAPATAILLILAKEQNIILAGLIAGFGALIGDLIIFNFIRHSFADEIKKLKKENIIIYVHKHIHKRTPNALKKYIIPIFAGFIIASPLPDEIGVSLFAASRKISTKVFSVVAYALNTLGIFIILFIGRII